MLVDPYYRVHDYLRISLTDACNLKCLYCMPDLYHKCMLKEHLMSVDEIYQISKIFVEKGVNKIRLTGGEPLVRKDFGQILSSLATLPVELTLTTNGILIDKYLELFKVKGICSVNVSLDSLNRDTFKQITKFDAFDKVWGNIKLLLKNDFHVKINVVAMENTVLNELDSFIQLTKKLPLHVRLIEFMPFAGNQWNSSKVITSEQMLQKVAEKYDYVKLKDEPNSTAKKYKIIGHEGTFAFISTMSEHFCGDCNRVRLTADGKLRNCLFANNEFDLLTPLRNGESIESIIYKCVQSKKKTLGGQMTTIFSTIDPTQLVNRSMIKIGG